MSELCERPPSKQVERAWKAIDATSNDWQPPASADGTIVYNSVKKLLHKAQEKRDEYRFLPADSYTLSKHPDTSNMASQSGTASTTASHSAPNFHDADTSHSEWRNTQSCVQESLAQASVSSDFTMPGGLEQVSTLHVPLAVSSGDTNLPDWFFSGVAVPNSNVVPLSAHYEAWDWTASEPQPPQGDIECRSKQQYLATQRGY